MTQRRSGAQKGRSGGFRRALSRRGSVPVSPQRPLEVIVHRTKGLGERDAPTSEAIPHGWPPPAAALRPDDRSRLRPFGLARCRRAPFMPQTSGYAPAQPCGPRPPNESRSRMDAGVRSRPSPLVAAVGTACHAEGRGFANPGLFLWPWGSGPALWVVWLGLGCGRKPPACIHRFPGFGRAKSQLAEV